MDNCPFTNKPCPHPKDIEITTKNGTEVQHLHLCQICGVSELAKSQLQTELKSLVGMLFNLLDKEPRQEVKCPSCGATEKDIIKESMFGCASCYVVHRSFATNILSRCQDDTKHVGKTPDNIEGFTADDITAHITNLEGKIKKAVELENYEIAAILKKKLDEIKKGGKSV
jgi:protein arginine kinase activator